MSESPDEAELEWEELLEDPATEACKQLLARIDEEEQQEQQEEQDHQRHDFCRTSYAFLFVNRRRPSPPSRAMSRCGHQGHCYRARLRFLKSCYVACRCRRALVCTRPSIATRRCRTSRGGCWEDMCLKESLSAAWLFRMTLVIQVQLCRHGIAFETSANLRTTQAASHNPELPTDALDQRRTTLRSVPAAKRSQAQAYFMVWHWLSRAVKPAQRPAKRARHS